MLTSNAATATATAICPTANHNWFGFSESTSLRTNSSVCMAESR